MENVQYEEIRYCEVLRKTKRRDEKSLVKYCCSIFKEKEKLLEEKEVSVTNAEGPPVPIPNTEVKLCSGENTLLEAARENSSMLTLR